MITAKAAPLSVPFKDDLYITVDASGTALEVNPGDYVAWSGNYAIAVNTGDAYWKASGVGIAIARNPKVDEYYGYQINTALLVATRGQFRVTAAFSGKPLYGTIVHPATTGLNVQAMTGQTGVGATWNTAAPLQYRPTAITYDYKDLASAISAYVAGSATGSALLPGSGILQASLASGSPSGVATVVQWYSTNAVAGTGQMDIYLWPRNADAY